MLSRYGIEGAGIPPAISVEPDILDTTDRSKNQLQFTNRLRVFIHASTLQVGAKPVKGIPLMEMMDMWGGSQKLIN